MSRGNIGLILGAIAGGLNAIIMLMNQVKPDVVISVSVLWVVIGYFIASTKLSIKGALKGLIISIVLFIPLSVPIYWHYSNTDIIVPVFVSNIVVGPIIAVIIKKIKKERH